MAGPVPSTYESVYETVVFPMGGKADGVRSSCHYPSVEAAEAAARQAFGGKSWVQSGSRGWSFVDDHGHAGYVVVREVARMNERDAMALVVQTIEPNVLHRDRVISAVTAWRHLQLNGASMDEIDKAAMAIADAHDELTGLAFPGVRP